LRRLAREWPAVAIALLVAGSALGIWAGGVALLLAWQMAPTEHQAIYYALRIGGEAVGAVLLGVLGLFIIDPVDEVHDPGLECLEIAYGAMFFNPIVWVAIACGWTWAVIWPLVRRKRAEECVYESQ
ncbi:MAG TPA: hypothetical protein VJG48_03850, partial [Candidatus Paceibacterota bacterium]